MDGVRECDGEIFLFVCDRVCGERAKQVKVRLAVKRPGDDRGARQEGTKLGLDAIGTTSMRHFCEFYLAFLNI